MSKGRGVDSSEARHSAGTKARREKNPPFMKVGSRMMAWLDPLRRRLLCLVGLHDWSEPFPFRDELYKHSTRRRQDYQRFCWRIDIGCSVRRRLRHIATFTPEQRRSRRRWRGTS